LSAIPDALVMRCWHKPGFSLKKNIFITEGNHRKS